MFPSHRISATLQGTFQHILTAFQGPTIFATSLSDLAIEVLFSLHADQLSSTVGLVFSNRMLNTWYLTFHDADMYVCLAMLEEYSVLSPFSLTCGTFLHINKPEISLCVVGLK